MLKRHLSDRTKNLGPEVKKTDVWMRMRLRDFHQHGFQYIETNFPENGAFLHNFSVLRQIGPSCGFVALRMAHHHLNCATSSAGASLLRYAIGANLTIDGECFNLEILENLCRRLPGVTARTIDFLNVSSQQIASWIRGRKHTHSTIRSPPGQQQPMQK